MTNAERFNSLVDEYLSKNSKYELQITNFRQYLKDKGLEEKVFNLNEDHIDEYFIYSFDEKIGAEATLTVHISALKSLFDFLISGNDLKFAELNGHINTTGFKEKMRKKLEKTFSKSALDRELLKSILGKIDLYIDENYNDVLNHGDKKRKQKLFETMIAQIYIKLSLILPIKTSQMLNLQLFDILNNEVRTIDYNDFKIKIPNSLRKQIISAIQFAQNEFKIKYSENDKIFEYLYACISRKATTEGTSQLLTKTYKNLQIEEMLERKSGGKKNKYVYPAECYKITAIRSMLENGTNVVYLGKLTGLDIGTLADDFNLEKNIEPKDDFSANINNGIFSSDYFTYL